ncbi:MAG: hypothetical protein KY469_07760 [Actinobacteria bacterium]|nr:hypothetical protein [Actinomycetota bacterium]
MGGTEGLDEATARWLTAAGREVVTRAAALFAEGEDALRIGVVLREGGLPPARAAAAAMAARARLAASANGWQADELLTTAAALEQASHPLVARWRSRRFAGHDTADLCAGTGSDATAIAATARRLVVVELDPGRVLLLAHNLRHHRAAAVRGDALRPPIAIGVAVHADPSRRTPRGRVRRLARYVPAVPALLAATEEAPGRAITVSPAVDLDDPDLPPGAEIEFIAVQGQLVEAVIWLGELRAPGVHATATLLPEERTWSRTTEVPGEVTIAPIGAILIEPNPALVRARGHDGLAERIGAHRVSRVRALLTTQSDPGPSPWYRRWLVEAVLPAHQRAVRTWLRSAPDAPLEIATAGIEATPSGWWEVLGRPQRGPQGRRLWLLRLDEGGVAVACRAI